MPRRAEAAPARAAAQLGIASPTRPCRCDALQRPRARERPQLALQRLGGRDQQIAQLAQPGPLCGDRALARSDKRLQRLAFRAAHGVWTLGCKDAAGGTDGVEAVGLTARA